MSDWKGLFGSAARQAGIIKETHSHGVRDEHREGRGFGEPGRKKPPTTGELLDMPSTPAASSGSGSYAPKDDADAEQVLGGLEDAARKQTAAATALASEVRDQGKGPGWHTESDAAAQKEQLAGYERVLGMKAKAVQLAEQHDAADSQMRQIAVAEKKTIEDFARTTPPGAGTRESARVAAQIATNLRDTGPTEFLQAQNAKTYFQRLELDVVDAKKKLDSGGTLDATARRSLAVAYGNVKTAVEQLASNLKANTTMLTVAQRAVGARRDEGGPEVRKPASR